MSDQTAGWGLNQKERLMVMAIRAVGLLLFGLGVPVIQIVVWDAYKSGWEGSGGDRYWSLGNLLHELLTRAFLLDFMSAAGVYLVAVVAGVYLMRCDPRPILRSAGVKV